MREIWFDVCWFSLPITAASAFCDVLLPKDVRSTSQAAETSDSDLLFRASDSGQSVSLSFISVSSQLTPFWLQPMGHSSLRLIVKILLT